MISMQVSGATAETTPLAHFNFLNAAKIWADAIGPTVNAALAKKAPRAPGPGSGKLAQSIRYERKVTEDSVAVQFISNVPYAGYVIDGTKRHVIEPRSARALAWLNYGHAPGAYQFAMRVNHPGTKPNPFPQEVLTEMMPEIQQALRDAMAAASGE
jgi:hypothetical protein